MDRPGVRQVPEGSGEQEKMEKTGCKIICGAPTTLAVKGLMMMMMSKMCKLSLGPLFTDSYCLSYAVLLFHIAMAFSYVKIFVSCRIQQRPVLSSDTRVWFSRMQ